MCDGFKPWSNCASHDINRAYICGELDIASEGSATPATYILRSLVPKRKNGGRRRSPWVFEQEERSSSLDLGNNSERRMNAYNTKKLLVKSCIHFECSSYHLK